MCVSVDDFVQFSDEEDDVPKGSLSKEEDSDFVMSDGEESGSDWGTSQRSSGRKVRSNLMQPSPQSPTQNAY